eukprot:GFKZ01008702.1.p1 GENE.GFKZ01008702.1~~GFKZ01008702.1.p1  ORF type:complete len:327 (-),score=31.40 GFKZ01008702.1:915-1808(-)
MNTARQRFAPSKSSIPSLSPLREIKSRRACLVALFAAVLGCIAGTFLTIIAVSISKSPLDAFDPATVLAYGLNTTAAYRNRNVVIDVDIGTWGSAMASAADKILTFDPFDEEFHNDTLDRFPFLVSDFTGVSTFYYNKLGSDCSTMNLITTFYNETLRDQRIAENCPGQDIPLDGILRCSHPPPEHVEERQVPVRRLSDILKQNGYTKIDTLKIDAQGTDFAILKDLLENAPHVSIRQAKVECQDYFKTIPLYITDNDCPRIESYVRAKFPGAKVERQMNVCWSAEFNLVITNMSRS